MKKRVIALIIMCLMLVYCANIAEEVSSSSIEDAYEYFKDKPLNGLSWSQDDFPWFLDIELGQVFKVVDTLEDGSETVRFLRTDRLLLGITLVIEGFIID